MRTSKVLERFARPLIGLTLLGLAGCSSSADNEAGNGVETPDGPTHPNEPLQIEESDIVRLDGARLYVLNRQAGLSVIDVSEPFTPKLMTRLDTLAGSAGELYVRAEDRVLALTVDSKLPCHALAPAEYKNFPSTAVSLIENATRDPKASVDRCVPGALVTSRLVGDMLYVVTSGGTSHPNSGFLYSIDASDPEDLSVIESLPLSVGEPEVLVTESAVFLAEPSGTSTRVRLIDISAGDGSLVERGTISVPGHSPSRFHLDAPNADSFRIVTRDPNSRMTALFVVDTRDRDHLKLFSTLQNLARGEELFATRFIGDRVYIVTYKPELVLRTTTFPGTDPLWVVSIEDPAHPTLLGRLEIPGWSDYVFPRGDQLFAVGRGTDGNRVAASLFDVRDPTHPQELRRLEFGSDRASTEAATDFRAVTIIEGSREGPDLALVPYSNNVGFGARCVPDHHLQLIELGANDLRLGGNVSLEGRVLRGLAVGDAVYGVTTREVAAIDATDLSRPDVQESVVVGDPARQEACVLAPEEPREVITTFAPREDEEAPFSQFNCTIGAGGTRANSLAMGALALAALGVLRRRLRSSAVRKGDRS